MKHNFCIAKSYFTQPVFITTCFGLHIGHHQVVLCVIIKETAKYAMFFIVVPCILTSIKFTHRGPGSSVGIATELRLDGPGSNPGGDETFRSSRPALGPTQPPV